MGAINNPQKSIYNKVYNKTTFGVSDLTSNSSNKNIPEEVDYLLRLQQMSYEDFTEEELDAMSIEELTAIHNGNQRRKNCKIWGVFLKIFSVVIAIVFGLPSLVSLMIPLFIFIVILCILLWKLGEKFSKEASKQKNESDLDSILDSDD